MKRIISLLAAVLAAVPLLSSCTPEPKRYEATFLTLFDTVTTIVCYTNDKEEFTGQVQFLHDRLEEYHRLYDIYEEYEGIANIRTINKNAGIAPVKVDSRIIELLQFAKEMDLQTGGRINVAFGSVLSVWHDYRTAGIDDPERAELPPMEQLRAAAEHTDIEKLIIDEEASTVFLTDPEMRLDVGAVAKGYAVEQVCREAKENGLTSCLVSVGGNVRAIGSRQGKPWIVGIQNPFEDGEKPTLMNVGLEEVSLVTSGIYQRYYIVDGKAYHHIIEPDTLMPSDQFAAVSIFCTDSGMADALSTAVFNMTYEEGFKLVESMEGVEALWVFPDGAERESSGFFSYRQSA